MKNLKIIFLLILAGLFSYGSFASADVQADPPLIFVLAGQSNMMSLGGNIDQIGANNDQIPTNVDFYAMTPGAEGSGFVERANFISTEYNTSQFLYGPEVSLAQKLSLDYPDRKIILVKYAVGATNSCQWKIKTLDTSTNSECIANGTTQTISQVGGTIRSGNFGLGNTLLDTLAAQFPPDENEYKAFIWFQGEADSEMGAPISAGIYNYQVHIKELFDNLKNRFNAPVMPMVMALISTQTGSQDVTGFRDTQTAFAQNNPNVYVVDSEALVRQDLWHIDASSVIAMGKCYAKALAERKDVNCPSDLAIVAPEITTASASFISSTAAVGNADLTGAGNENPEIGIEWGTTSGSYTHSCSAGHGPAGYYSCDMTELSLDTKYYYRAKATNSAGTSYGLEKSFTTNVAYQAFQRKILDMADIGVLKISDDEFYVSGTSGGQVIKIYKTTDLESFTLHHTFDPSAIDGTYDYCDVMGPDLALTDDSNMIISFSAVRVAKEAACPEVVNSVKTIYQSSRTSAAPWVFGAPYALQYTVNGTSYGTGTGGNGEEIFKLAPMVRDGRIYYTWFDNGNNISSIGLAEPHDLVNHTNGKDFPDEFIHEGSTVFERNGLSYFSFNRYNWMESYTQSYMYGNSGVTNLVRSPGESVLDMAQPIHTFSCAINDVACIYENAGGGDVFSRNGQYYFMYHKAFPKENRMKRSAYLTPIYFDTDGRIISITNTTLNWANMGSGMEYSLAVKPVGQNWIAPCIGAGIIGSNTAIEFGGLCQTAGDVVVHKGEVAQFRICYSDDNWVSSKCSVINNDVTKDSLYVDLSTPVTAPLISLPSGAYIGSQRVELSTSTPLATIYYTTDGSIPSANSNLYSSPLTISQNTTLKAIATKENMLNSEISAETYVITSGAVVDELTPAQWQSDFEDGLISLNGTITESTQATFNVEYVVQTDGLIIVIPVGTRITKMEGDSFDLTALISRQFSINGVAGAIKLGIPNAKLSFSQPISLSIQVGTQHDGKTFDVLYKNDNEDRWNPETTCLILGGNCQFTTNHATYFAAREKKSSTSENKNKKKKEVKKKRIIKNSKIKLHHGDVLYQSGRRFSKADKVALYFGKYGGGYYAPEIIRTNKAGNFVVAYKIPPNKPQGTYSWYAVDLKTGKKSRSVYYRVK